MSKVTELIIIKGWVKAPNLMLNSHIIHFRYLISVNQSWIFIGRTCSSWNSNTLATWCKELIPWKRPWCWERLKAGGEGDDRGWDGWHHWLNRHEFEQALGVGDGQGSPAWCSPWGHKELDTTEWLNWTEPLYACFLFYKGKDNNYLYNLLL